MTEPETRYAVEITARWRNSDSKALGAENVISPALHPDRPRVRFD